MSVLLEDEQDVRLGKKTLDQKARKQRKQQKIHDRRFRKQAKRDEMIRRVDAMHNLINDGSLEVDQQIDIGFELLSGRTLSVVKGITCPRTHKKKAAPKEHIKYIKRVRDYKRYSRFGNRLLRNVSGSYVASDKTEFIDWIVGMSLHTDSKVSINKRKVIDRNRKYSDKYLGLIKIECRSWIKYLPRELNYLRFTSLGSYSYDEEDRRIFKHSARYAILSLVHQNMHSIDLSYFKSATFNHNWHQINDMGIDGDELINYLSVIMPMIQRKSFEDFLRLKSSDDLLGLMSDMDERALAILGCFMNVISQEFESFVNEVEHEARICNFIGYFKYHNTFSLEKLRSRLEHKLFKKIKRYFGSHTRKVIGQFIDLLGYSIEPISSISGIQEVFNEVDFLTENRSMHEFMPDASFLSTHWDFHKKEFIQKGRLKRFLQLWSSCNTSALNKIRNVGTYLNAMDGAYELWDNDIDTICQLLLLYWDQIKNEYVGYDGFNFCLSLGDISLIRIEKKIKTAGIKHLEYLYERISLESIRCGHTQTYKYVTDTHQIKELTKRNT